MRRAIGLLGALAVLAVAPAASAKTYTCPTDGNNPYTQVTAKNIVPVALRWGGKWLPRADSCWIAEWVATWGADRVGQYATGNNGIPDHFTARVCPHGARCEYWHFTIDPGAGPDYVVYVTARNGHQVVTFQTGF